MMTTMTTTMVIIIIITIIETEITTTMTMTMTTTENYMHFKFNQMEEQLLTQSLLKDRSSEVRTI
jgi:hypothetical protein